jgi:phospholipase/carboxylesterase
VVLMHGFGAPGDDLVGLAEMLDVPEGTTFVFPEALHALSELPTLRVLGDGRAWWPIDFERRASAIERGALHELLREEPPGLARAREAVLRMLDSLPRERLVLGGFSQGAMLAADVALRSDVKLDGLVLLSGTIIAEDEWRARLASRAGLPVFQSHGTDDPLLPYAIAEQLRDALVAAGMSVTFDSFDGGHGIPPATMKRLGEWLRALKG